MFAPPSTTWSELRVSLVTACNTKKVVEYNMIPVFFPEWDGGVGWGGGRPSDITCNLRLQNQQRGNGQSHGEKEGRI